MKKLTVLLLSLFCFFSFNVKSQIYGGGTLGLQAPVGDFADCANMGVGINLFGKYMLNDKMAVGANLGYNRFGCDDYDLDGLDFDFTYSIIPVTGLFEYHFGGDAIKPYVGGDLGVYNLTTKVSYAGDSEKDSELYFGLAPTAGILYGLNESLTLCANIKFHNVFVEEETLSWIGINAGVVIPIK